MYKQRIEGIRRPILAIVLAVFVMLLFASVLETIYKTSYATLAAYVIAVSLFTALLYFIYEITVVKYEYAVLDNELIVRKFRRAKPARIFSIKLVRSNCIYKSKGSAFALPWGKHIHPMYLPFMNVFQHTASISFVDNDNIRIKIYFKPDDILNEEILRIKTTKW